MIYFLLWALVMFGVCWLAADIHRHERSTEDQTADDEYLEWYLNWLEFQRDLDDHHRMIGEYDPYYNYGLEDK